MKTSTALSLLWALPVLVMAPALHAEGMAALSLGQALYGDALENSLPQAESIDMYGLSYKVYAGLALTQRLSVHAGFFSLGSAEASNHYNLQRSNNHLESHGFFGEGRWQWRAGNAWRPYAKLGGAIINTKAIITTSTSTTSNTAEDTRASFVLTPGVGMVYETLSHWGVQLEAERYLSVKAPAGLQTQDIDNLSLGIYAYW